MPRAYTDGDFLPLPRERVKCSKDSAGRWTAYGLRIGFFSGLSAGLLLAAVVAWLFGA
jgi:hypothetical protein